ncbi:MAG: methyltransferase [Candidatus Marinimicrobia bacterium]|nr:methyltransferase [Candidatus Neomarinimicrobiota bacterium]|tara:strand:+ start:5329 stop:5964 length:636 start_codon:yes stop_codon:yes gene_type:complete
MNFISKELESYCSKFSFKDSELLVDLKKYTYKSQPAPQMICGQTIGGLLQFIVQIANVKNILEIGTFTGYSALKMAEVLPDDGSIKTCELFTNHIKTAKEWFSKSKYSDKIKLIEGHALNSMEDIKVGSVDLIFVDADKVNYPEYFLKGVKLLKSGGIGVFDNMLWGGAVLNPNDKESNAINNTNKLISNSNQVKQILLPLRDGVTLFIKK